MFLLALKNLVYDKVRFGLSVFGVAFSLTLLLFLFGIYQGTLEQATGYISSLNADMWVAQEGTHDLFHTFSLVPVSMRGKLESFSEIEKAYPLIARTTSFTLNGIKNNISIVGIEEDQPFTRPRNLSKGFNSPREGEIVVDQNIFTKNNFSLGDEIRLGSDEEENYEDKDSYRIIGVSKDTSVLVFQYGFVNFKDAQKILGTKQAVNYYVVKTLPGTNLSKLKEKIERRIDKTTVFTNEQFLSNNADLIKDSFLPILAIIITIGFIIGISTIGLIIYTSTVEKTREYGILKAIGMSNSRLYFIVILQTIIISVLAYAFSVAFALIVEHWVESQSLGIRVTYMMKYFYIVFYSGLAMSIIATYIPIRVINKIDPVIVFKS